MLRYAVLALLARASLHGYELKAAFERLLGGTWTLNIGQVYTVLAKLEADGLVECRVEPQDKVPDRKVYSLTEKGEAQLTAVVERTFRKLGSNRDLIPLYNKWFVARLPTGEKLNVAISPQLEEAFKVLDDTQGNSNN